MTPLLRKKELVALLMESPLYFEMRVWERLELLREHLGRASCRPRPGGVPTPPRGGRPDCGPAPVWPRPAVVSPQTGFVVGYFPPKRRLNP
jgi:hypothetical protein